MIIEHEIKLKNIQVAKPFVDFLNDSGLLSKAHPKKAKVLLDDIFIYPELIKYDDIGDVEKKISSELLINEFTNCSKLLLAGENQSGKTTLCKKLYKELRARNFVPIYVSDKNSQYEGLIENRIENSFKEQYLNISFKDIDKKRIVPIVDDFHFANKKENRIQELAAYRSQILIVDEVFSLNFQDERLTKNYTQYKVKQFSPSLRNDLIRKWVCLDENKVNPCLENSVYKSLDDATELINNTLGKIISSGIMPAYPFFILSVLSTYETFEKPLDQEITSQGYCYQALYSGPQKSDNSIRW